MASVQQKGQSFYCQFSHEGKRHTVTIGKVSRGAAEAFAVTTDELLNLIRLGRVAVPNGIPITEFIVSGGKPTKSRRKHNDSTFEQIRDEYLSAHAIGAMESNSLQTVKMHLRHIERTLGLRFALHNLSRDDLQRHISERAKKTIGGKKLSATTIRKEIASFRAMWNWAVDGERLTGKFPSRNLQYPKLDEKPPFQTWDEIERRIDRGGLSETEKRDLWECLYLKIDEIAKLLQHVKENAIQPWVYPIICTAAYTGARRSELLRMEFDDCDLDTGTIVIRERKRTKGRRTTRRVAMGLALRTVLADWLEQHPGGPFLFCQKPVVERSKKRNRTTELNGQTEPITKDEAHDHFKRVLAGSKWEVVRGFHTLRHSFISAMAAKGIDQRIIDDFVGHQTEEQRRRYRHLIPEVKQQAIDVVFG